jgi:hypothetical protein
MPLWSNDLDGASWGSMMALSRRVQVADKSVDARERVSRIMSAMCCGRFGRVAHKRALTSRI